MVCAAAARASNTSSSTRSASSKQHQQHHPYYYSICSSSSGSDDDSSVSSSGKSSCTWSRASSRRAADGLATDTDGYISASDTSSSSSDSDIDNAIVHGGHQVMGSIPGYVPFLIDHLQSSNAYSNLPAWRSRKKIIKAIQRNSIVCVSGETGCGKSTMIPLSILLYAASNASPTSLKVMCTQPRRVAAIKLTGHIQSLIKDAMGNSNKATRNNAATASSAWTDIVGYRVRGHKSDIPHKSQLVYVTTGYLKQLLIHNPDQIASFTHIVLDEVHERGIDSDFLSLIVKRLLSLPQFEHIK